MEGAKVRFPEFSMLGAFVQVELLGQCPPIEKMDATLSTLKACVYAVYQDHFPPATPICCHFVKSEWPQAFGVVNEQYRENKQFDRYGEFEDLVSRSKLHKKD